METGDLIFTQIGCPSNAISAVTKGFCGARVNHIGIIVENELGKQVLEAYCPEVRLTSLETHIDRSKDNNSKPRYMLGRLAKQHHHMIPTAITYGLEQQKIPYDELYLSSESALYCSELIVDMFKHANSGNEFFEEKPMSFQDHATGKLHQHWVSYYEHFSMPVPETEPGSNPGDISKDKRLQIYDVVGDITGFQPL